MRLPWQKKPEPEAYISAWNLAVRWGIADQVQAEEFARHVLSHWLIFYSGRFPISAVRAFENREIRKQAVAPRFTEWKAAQMSDAQVPVDDGADPWLDAAALAKRWGMGSLDEAANVARHLLAPRPGTGMAHLLRAAPLRMGNDGTRYRTSVVEKAEREAAVRMALAAEIKAVRKKAKKR